GGHEERTRVVPDDLVEAERFVVERRRLVDVAHVEMNVADGRTRWRTGPRLVAGRRDEVRGVERNRGHRQLARRVPPSGPRTVGVDLDADAVRIAQVNRLAHEVIRHPRLAADVREMSQKAS